MTNDLKFSGESPVVITYNGSENDIYAPVRTSSCDINLVSPSILDDLYTARKDEIGVRVKKDGDIIWEGYKMPNTYSQEVSQNLDEVSVTCIDPVSIMKYITIDKVFDRPNVCTYRELIGKSLAYVMLDSKVLWVERVVGYDGDGLLDLSVQIANFWDEDDKPSTIYEMIEEILRPFCLTLVYFDSKYQIYCSNTTTGTWDTHWGQWERHFDIYSIGSDGGLTTTTTNYVETKKKLEFEYNEWKSNNTATPIIEINNTYEKVTGVASTCVPSYSRMATDDVDMSMRDLYETGQFNVQKNKSKGYKKVTRMIYIRPNQGHLETVIEPVTEDKWFYMWNGSYTNSMYHLEDSGSHVSWYNNCNGAYTYLTGGTGHPNCSGSTLNFYGGVNNLTATGKTQPSEKSVSVEKKITSYAPDNGMPLEFLENADISWTYAYAGSLGGYLTKTDTSNTKWGTSKTMGSSDRIVYHQEFDNIALSSVQDNILDFSLSKTFSRTGIDTPVEVMHNNTATNKSWGAGGRLNTADSKYFPIAWDAKNVKVDSDYFGRYASNGTGSNCRPIWDYIRVDVYVQLSDNSYYQFNGYEWVMDGGQHQHPFYLGKMMTYENLYHNDFRYNVIRSSADSTSFTDPIKHSLTDEDYIFYVDSHQGVTDRETNDFVKCPPLKDQGIEWIADCSEGSLSIKLPYVDDASVKVFVDVYNSSMLGMTGLDSAGAFYIADQEPFYYATQEATTETTPYFREIPTTIGFAPVNVSYIKAEHLDLNLSVTVPESNLGQMFSESDIKYVIESTKNYTEEFSGPSFQVNTYNPLVASSFSYILYNNHYADPTLFSIYELDGRPEAFVMQAYYNWLTKIRKVYTKTLIPQRYGMFSNVRWFITSPEVGSNELMVISDSWDVKTGRHTVKAIEDQNLEVDYVSDVDIFEIPRMARAYRYNLPTATVTTPVRRRAGS